MGLLQEWVARLGLQEWRIKLKTGCNESEMLIPGCSGCSEWTETNKTALIEIISEEEHGERIIEWDFERILVHELLHLKFSLLEGTRWNSENWMPDRYTHQLIDDMARALVCAKRGILKIDLKEGD